MSQVQKIACTNNAGFDMNFSIKWMNSDNEWNTTVWNSGTYPIDQTRTSPDLVSIGVPADAVSVTPEVHAVLGKTHTGNPYVTYEANNNTATYEVKGTVLNFSVDLIGGGGAGEQPAPAAAVVS